MKPWSALILAAGLGTAVGGVFGIQYVTGTAPAQLVVEGVQGRYFLPLALAGTVLLPAFGVIRVSWLQKPLMLLVIAFPLISLAIMMHAIVWRYYLE